MNLSKNKIKYLLSLQLKKNRLKERSFLVEGEKIATEVLTQKRYKIKAIYALSDWLEDFAPLLAQYKPIITVVTTVELKKISSLKSPNRVLIELEAPTDEQPSYAIQNSLSLVLENIQDPGNLGTIIRIADWFGISTIFCSIGCVDVYNSKTLQASMGGFLRVSVVYTQLPELLQQYPQLPVYGAILQGENVFQTPLQATGFLLIGNEGKGLSEHLQTLITHPVTIPKYGGAESLNAAVATGILCALFRQSGG